MTACGSSPAPNPGAAVPNGTYDISGDRRSGVGIVWGSLSYSGTALGPSVYAGLFRYDGASVPTKPPDFAMQIKWPDFPVTYSLVDIPPGPYVVAAFLSVDNEHPTGPQPNDAISTFTRIEVSADRIVKQDLVLSDPAHGSPPQ